MLWMVVWVGRPTSMRSAMAITAAAMSPPRAPATTAPPATEPAAQIVGRVNCPAAMDSGVSASRVARMPATAIDTSTTTTPTVRRR